MRDSFALLFALIFLVVGAALLAGENANSDVTQTARMLAGAAFLSVGLICLSLALKSWLKWKRDYKEYRDP